MERVVYDQPKTLQELQVALEKASPDTVVLGGGTDLLISIRNQKPYIDRYISIGKVEDFIGIRREGDWLRIGAMTVHQDIADEPLVKEYFSALSMACDHVGSQQIRNKGTIGGSLANASPAGDLMPCVFLFHGEVEIFNKTGVSRRIPVEDFLREKGKTILETGEVLRAVWLPIQEKRRSCFVKLGARTDVTIAQISLCLSWKEQGEGKRQVEAYLGAVDVRPMKIEEAKELLGEELTDEKKDAFSALLEERIRKIRENRKRPPKLRITEAERLYKERAVKGVVYDAVAYMEGL